jgi:hypothetical protein
MEVHFAIPIVWIASESVQKMKQMTKVSNTLKAKVNNRGVPARALCGVRVRDVRRFLCVRCACAGFVKFTHILRTFLEQIT